MNRRDFYDFLIFNLQQFPLVNKTQDLNHFEPFFLLPRSFLLIEREKHEKIIKKCFLKRSDKGGWKEEKIDLRAFGILMKILFCFISLYSFTAAETLNQWWIVICGDLFNRLI